MSAEYEAKGNVAPRNDMQKSLKNESSNDDDDTLEDLAGSANNSIIGKVKSRVSSIIPSSFSKWFSPSTPNNVTSFSVGTARRRRRLEIDDDEYIDDTNEANEDAVLAHSEYKANLPSRSGNIKDSDEDDTDNNSEEELTNEAGVHSQRGHYTMKTYGTVSQPPSKRSRISFDTTNIHQPLVASTPAIGDSHRNVHINSPSLEDKLYKTTGSHSIRHYTETPAYNQREVEHQTSFAFPPTTAKDVKIQENIASKLNSNEKIFENISSRRTLHLPSTSQVANERSMGYSSHKRQSLSGIRDVNKHTGETPLMNTSTTIIVDEDEAQSSRNEQTDFKTNRNLNGSTLLVSNSKKQRLNGTDEAEESNADSASECSEGCVGNISELPNKVLSLRQRKTGLFNMSNLNSQNGKSSRTSSFGNGINFYSHLEGRKSLFSGGTQSGDPSNTLNNSTLSLTSLNRRQFNASIYGSTSALSDSRLLNTFSPFYKGKTTYGGAAAYKKYSTGASRVCTITPTIIRPTSSLSTLSSSNNSLAATTGPTNNALSGLGSNSVAENTSAISSTAKRILDLINDFATPLSEAKKMANSNVVKANPQTLPQAKTRLNETDLQTSRAIRLSQVRTPYARPAVTLQPISRNALAFPPPVRELQVPSMSQLLQMKKMQSTTERSRQIAMQNSSSTTRSNVGSGAYKLPLAAESSVVDKEYVPAHQQQQQQQQHTNKIKSKVRTSARITASKNVTNLENDELPPTINLPNIAFPQMQSVPTFDIAVSKPQNITTAASSEKTDLAKFDSFTKAADAGKVSSANSGGATINNSIFTNKTKTNFGICNSNNYTIEQTKNSENVHSNDKDKASAVFTETKMNFKFSNPLVIAEVAAADISAQKIVKKYTFSPPATVIFGASSIEATSAIQHKIQSSESPSVPQLKSGSVLDALKKTFNSPTATKDNKVISTGDAELKVGFGDQFKKSAENKWECETCLIRNDSNLNKCVACETPRATLTPINQQTTPKDTLLAPLNAGTSTFGGQFKKPTDQWECEVCMIRNKEQDNKCVACETPRKVASASCTKLSASLDNASNSWKPNTFGDTFKPKPNTWECPTCLINNKSDSNECVACQTKNPSSSVSDTITQNKAPTTFKFGFSASTNNTTTATQSTTAASADTGFKTIAAAQMSAKWECDACMTRNDAVRSKCVCCEQAKPGATTPDVPSNGPKFTFGSTASTKYTFGFGGANANEAPTAVSNNPATSAAISNEKTDGASAKGFIFGNKSSTTTSIPSAGGMGFSFGIKPASSTAENATSKKSSESKDITDKGSGSSTAAISEEKASGFKFGVPPSTGTSSTTTTATSPAVKFSLAMPATTSEPVKSDAIVTPTVKTTTAGFTFGSSSITNAASQPAASGFSFGAPAKTISGETSTATTGSAKTTASFSFGTTTVSTQANQTAATSSTATVKPMFSFGNNTTPPKTTSALTLASASTTISSSNAAPLTNPTGGFSFGSTSTPGTATSSSTAKSLFGSFVSPTTTISVTTSAITPVPATTMPKLSAAPTTNVFGTFGEHASSAKTTTTTSAASTTLPPTTSTNIFGVTPSGSSGDSKPTASATMIFGSASNATSTNKATGTPFVFGSSSSTTTPQSSTAAASGGIVATGTSWPKGGFAFGGSTANSGTSNTNDSSKPVFGSFMNAAAPVAAASTTIPAMGAGNSVFGNISASSTISVTTATFGSVAANASTPSPAAIFGTGGGSTASTQPTPNLFGSAATTTSAFGAAPSFGSGNNNMGNNASTFGVASPTQFGSFGSTTSSRTSAADGASAPKKSEPAFNFGGNTSQVGSSGGFNFGAQASTAAKPAFNFSASNVPTFNFTGSSGDAAKPFQFGATPAAPVFNFSGGAVEATPNAPFQFNAGSAPASSNIFAPTPAAPNAAGGPVQARRKIRQPTRRLTPR